MPGTLSFDAYGDAIGAAATVLRANASAVRLDTPVPTCPEWSVRDLVLHQGMVHRWVTELLRAGQVTEGADHHAQGAAAPDVLDWFDAGATALLQVLSTAPGDLDVPVFVRDAEAPLGAWARRQAHETTIHAVDAMAARLGRAPYAGEVWFSPELALDGVDELLLGILPRDSTSLHSPEPRTVHVAPTGAGRAYAVTVSRRRPRAVVLGTDAGQRPPDAVVAGPAKEVYLALWNRGGEVTVTGDRTLLDLWHEQMRVSG